MNVGKEGVKQREWMTRRRSVAGDCKAISRTAVGHPNAPLRWIDLAVAAMPSRVPSKSVVARPGEASRRR